MSQDFSINVSSTVLSLLLYENAKSDYDQRGFLLGKYFENKTQIVTDNEQEAVKTERKVIITSIIPCPTNFFFDEIGRVNKKFVKNLLGDQAESFVAWYIYKDTSSFRLTLREKIIHKQLLDICPIAPEFFTCCLLTADTSANSATHVFLQSFIRYSNRIHEQIPMHIINLSDSKDNYKSAEPSSETFNNIIESLNIDSATMQGYNTIKNIHSALETHVDQLVGDLADSERELFQLEQEVKQLGEKLDKEEENKVLANGGGDGFTVNNNKL